MKRISVAELTEKECASRIVGCLREKRISFEISEAEKWVQVNACGPCAERLQKEGKPVEGCEKCVKMTREIIEQLGYTGTLLTE